MLTFDSIHKILYLSDQLPVAYSNSRNQKYFPHSKTHKNLGYQLCLSTEIQLSKVSEKITLTAVIFAKFIIQDSRFCSRVKLKLESVAPGLGIHKPQWPRESI